MGFLGKILGGNKASKEPDLAQMDLPPCPHSVLLPHWDSIDDMGKDERADSYRCESCGATFTGEEGRAIRQTASAERIFARPV